MYLVLHLTKKINMNKTLFAALSVCFLLSCKDSLKNSATIKVSGEGKIRIKPDLIIMTINVDFVQPRMADAVRLSQQTADTVVAILMQFAQEMTLRRVTFLQIKNMTITEAALCLLDIKQNKALILS